MRQRAQYSADHGRPRQAWVSEGGASPQLWKPVLLLAHSCASLYTSYRLLINCHMNLKSFSDEELEQLLKILPEEIRRREAQGDDAEEAERRKRSVFASFQELAKKQGVNLADL